LVTRCCTWPAARAVCHDTTFIPAFRPEAHLFSVNLVNTGNVNSRDADLINPEVAFVRGPLSVQGEYTHVFASEVDRPNRSTTVSRRDQLLSPASRASLSDAIRPLRTRHPDRQLRSTARTGRVAARCALLAHRSELVEHTGHTTSPPASTGT
jgi:hypothetical protein